MTLEFKQLHPLFGAEISGVDLASEIDDSVFAEIRDAFEEYSVLVFRDQKVDDAQQIAFSERFGPLERMLIGSQGAGTPVAYLSNVDRDTGEIIEPDDKRMVRNACNMLWHSDSSFKRVPALGSILSGREVPENGGETEYASMRAAYDTLSEEMKRRIDGLVAEHSFDYSRSLVDSILLDDAQRDEVPPVPQRLVVQNPVNGRKALYVGSHASHILDMPVEEGRALIRELLDHATRDKFVYRHRWRQNEIVMWDNRAVIHRGRPWDFRTGRRIMHRTTLAGTLPTVEQPVEAYHGP